MVLKYLIELIVKITLNISNTFNLISVKLIDNFSINIYKAEKENEILKNTEDIKEEMKLVSKDKEREEIFKDLINREIININHLNKVSNSEHFIIIPKLHMEIKDKEIKKLLFGRNGFFHNSIFKYFKENNYINLGKSISPFYIKSRKDLKKNYAGILVFKQYLDQKMISLLKKDNNFIINLIKQNNTNVNVKKYFYNKDGELKTEKYLFFDFMIVCSLNLNKENLTLIDEEVQKSFLLKILTQEIQNVKLKEIIIEAGIKVLLSEKYPMEIKNILLENENNIKNKLNIVNFLEDINQSDLRNVLKTLLGESYDEEYTKEFVKIHSLIKKI